MKYTYLKGWRGYQNGTGGPYEMPIIAHQDFYNRLPVPGSPNILIAQGATEGYLEVSSLMQPVCTALGFNPYKIHPYMINNAGATYDLIPEIISAFMGESVLTNDNGNFWYPTYSAGDTANYGPINYAVGYSVTQAGYGTTSYGAAGNQIAFYNCMNSATKYTSNDAVQYIFEIWPETVIEKGYIDTQHFQTDEGRIRVGHIIITIWKGANDRYNFDIYLQSTQYYSSGIDTQLNNLNGEETEHVYNPANPLDNKQEDGTEGGDGSWNNDSDPVDVPDLPSLDISDLGGINLYKVTATDVKTLMAYLGSAAPGDNILKWFNNPIQGIVSLHVLPYPVNSASGGAGITVLGMATGAAGYKISQFQEWDLGGVHVDYGFGNCFLDYEPYSHCQIYLPFIGIRSLDMDEVVGQTVSVTYQFDNVSGACIAFIRINSAVRYSFSGSCAIGIPISQSNWGQSYMAVATIAAGGIAGAVGAGAAAMGGATSMGAVAGNAALGAGQGIATSSGLGAAIGKPTISRSGSISGAASALGVPYPYLIIERPEKAKVANPAPVTGLACGRTLSLASLSGYNIIEHVHLHGIAATGEELQEIERLLYEGVVF